MAKVVEEKKPTSSELNQIYTDCESAHSALFAEQRSNVLLSAGNHYTKKGSAFWKNIRESSNINRDQKIRLTKNHVQKIVKNNINNLLHYAPGVSIRPKNQSEFHDQKVAELHESVWRDLKKRKNYERLKYLLVKDFVEIGEAFLKITFDKDSGDFVAYEQSDENDIMVPDRVGAESVFTGDIDWERINAFNVLTDPSARSWEEVRYVILRKMVPTADLKKQFEGDEDKLKFVEESSKQTYMLFDSADGSYRPDSKGLTMVREYYYRPCSKYPDGYYFICTEKGILHDGPLPYGIFPILYLGYDDASTSARSFSIIKQIRPYQAEINRCASSIVEHQLTVGSDKLVMQAGSTVSPGVSVHGIKTIKASGPVDYLAGRTGDQYLAYMDSQIKEMYFVANQEEDATEKAPDNLDPYALLFRAVKDKKKFIIYADKLKNFLIDWAFISLYLAKKDYTNDMIVQVLDKKERVNIAEFKAADDLSFEIIIDEQSEDVESKLGQQLAINHLVQFAGNKLEPQDIGQLVKNMPFVNSDEIFTDLTIDYDNVRSDILAMDRGIFVPANAYDNHEYVIKRLIHRMKMKDFQFLSPAIQSNYEIKKQQHEQTFEEQRQSAAALTSGFIPSGGFLVKVDVRIQDPQDGTKTKILKLPVESISWLVERLEKQGTTQAMLQSLEPEVQADMGRQLAVIGPSQGDEGLAV